VFIGSAVSQPAGTTFIWITSVIALIIDLILVLFLMLELDEVIFPQRSFVSWPLIVSVIDFYID
jgi:uncharacterized integral membrane protein